MDDPWSDPEFGAGEPCEEARLLAELQQALRGCLADLRVGVREIPAQLAEGVAELRAGVEPRSLAVALANLRDFFALLAQMNESFDGRSLPALDRLDAEVRRGVAELEASLEGGARDALAAGVETGLATVFEGWPAVAQELDLAIAALAPDFPDASA